MALISWSEADLEKIRAAVRFALKAEQNPQQRAAVNPVEDEEHQSPEFYVGKTTTVVTALDGDTVGRGTARIYQVIRADGNDPVLEEVEDFDKDVLNLGGEVDTGEWVQFVRDKFGRWWLVTPGAGGGDTTFLAVLTAKEYLPDHHIAYSWSRVVNAPPWGYVEVCPYVRGCPGHTPAYHERGLDVATVHDAPAESGTGTDPCTSADGVLCPGPEFIDRLSIFRLRRISSSTDRPTGTGTGTDQGGYCLFSGHPWVDLFVRTGESDEFGEIVYHLYYDPNTELFTEGRECRLIETP